MPIASLKRGKTLPTHECPRYDTKQLDGDDPVMLKLLGMRIIPSLPPILDPF